MIVLVDFGLGNNSNVILLLEYQGVAPPLSIYFYKMLHQLLFVILIHTSNT